MTKIIDTYSRAEIKGRVRFVTRWTADATRIAEMLTDADAEKLSGGKSRAALVEAIRKAERTNAERTRRGDTVARECTTVYARDNGCPDAEGAWWPAEIAE